MQDPYRILNVARGASASSIKTAYRELAKRLHPDRNPGDRRAEQRFKQVTQAYELLRDPEKRAQFDRGQIDADGKPQFGFGNFGFGGAGARGAGGSPFGGGDGLFDKIFGGGFGQAGGFDGLRGARSGVKRTRGEDRRCRVEVDFLRAALGGKQRVELGARVLEIDIPPGCKDGSILRLKGQGNPGNLGGPAGDLLATILVQPHELFSLQGKDVHVELPISLPEAVMGAKVTVPTIAGTVRITVPPGSNSGRSLRLKGRGVAVPGATPGDQLVRLIVTLPEQPDPDLDDFVRRWAKDHAYNPRSEPEDL